MTVSLDTAERLRRLACCAAAVSLMAVCIGTLLPGEDLPANLPPDILLHSLGFGTPTLFAVFAASSRRQVLLVVVSIAITAFATEMLQHFVPGRTVSLHDLLANAAGIAIGGGLGRLVRAALRISLPPAAQGSGAQL